MSVDSAMLAAIEEIYGAAADESRWSQVLQHFLGLTESVAATFCVIGGSDEPRFLTFTALNFEQPFIDEYLQGMMARDPTVRHIIAHPNQRLIHDSQVITEREKDRHLYYDWHHGFSDTRHRLAGMTRLEGDASSGVTVHRTRQQGDYHSSHIQRFEALPPHLERAINLGFRLGSFSAMQRMSFELLDANPLGIIVLDESGGTLSPTAPPKTESGRRSALQKPIHRQRIHFPRGRMIEGLGQDTDDLKAETLPEMDGPFIRADDQIELHGGEAFGAGALQRISAHPARNASSPGIGGGHIAAVGDMGAAAKLVRAKVIGAEQPSRLLGDEGVSVGARPIGDRRLRRHVAGQRIGFPGPNDRLDDRPNRRSVGTARGPDDQRRGSFARGLPKLTAGLGVGPSSAWD